MSGPSDAQDSAAHGASAALPVLEASGFSAHVDACAWEPAPRDQGAEARPDQLWFVSLLGAQQALKALWARLVQGERVTLRVPVDGGQEKVRFCALARAAASGPVSWRLFSASLPFSAGYHAIVAPVIALHADERGDFLLLPRDEREAPALHYRFLNRRVPLPLHPSWADWLWRRAAASGEALPLEAHGVTAYRCAPDVDALRADVTGAIRRGRLATDSGR